MNFVSVVCPHCGKELQVPEDAGKIVCMYCAEPIDVKALLEEESGRKGENYERLMQQAESLLNDEIFSSKIEMRKIKQNNYAQQFESYQKLFRPALQAYSLAATENDAAADHFARVLFDRFVSYFEKIGIKKESDIRFFDCRYMIVAFTIPTILELHTPAAEALADRFLEIWNENYPKNRLGKSNFESINGGFRKKLCFITTAVCASLGKEDDCTELSTFRRFRDEWLANTPEGRAKINEYYLFAPMIVRSIDNSSEKDRVYRELWDTYLQPCMKHIQSGEYESCAKQYEQMVTDMEQKWLN